VTNDNLIVSMASFVIRSSDSLRYACERLVNYFVTLDYVSCLKYLNMTANRQQLKTISLSSFKFHSKSSDPSTKCTRLLSRYLSGRDQLSESPVNVGSTSSTDEDQVARLRFLRYRPKCNINIQHMTS
jgi:hypothetical protein